MYNIGTFGQMKGLEVYTEALDQILWELPPQGQFTFGAILQPRRTLMKVYPESIVILPSSMYCQQPLQVWIILCFSCGINSYSPLQVSSVPVPPILFG